MSTGRRRGFTLVEMMVALVIFMLFMGAVYGMYTAAQSAIVHAEEQETLYQTGRVLLAQLNAELTCLYVSAEGPAVALLGEDAGTDERPEDSITFLTTAHVAAEGQLVGDVSQVRYSLEDESADERPGLYVEESFPPDLAVEDAEPTRRLLSPLVTGVNFLYLPPGGDTWEMSWVDQETLPTAIRVELTLCAPRADAKPIVLLSTANLAMATAGETTDAQP